MISTLHIKWLFWVGKSVCWAFRISRLFSEHEHGRPSAATGNSFGGSDSHHSPGGVIAGGGRRGDAALHPVSRDEGLCSGVPSNINVVSDPPVLIMEGRGDSTAASITYDVVQDILSSC